MVQSTDFILLYSRFRSYNTRSAAIASLVPRKEAKLMLTNPRDAFRSQSRSPNIVTFHMLGIVSSCAIVTLSLRRAGFYDIQLQKCRDLENRVRGPSRSLEISPFDTAHIASY